MKRRSLNLNYSEPQRREDREARKHFVIVWSGLRAAFKPSLMIAFMIKCWSLRTWRLRGENWRILWVKLPVLGVLLIMLLGAVHSPRAQTSEAFVYVWDFTTRDHKKNDLTAKLTEEFEEALIQAQCFVVLERRKYDRLIAQKDNEKAISEIEGISTATLDSLKFYQANAVIFGEVYDDDRSGEIKVSITLQAFKGVKKVWSTRFTRGKQYDAESREEAMKMLVSKIKLSERAGARDYFYNSISKQLTEYILRAENLKDAFNYLPGLAEGSKEDVVNELADKIRLYNKAFDSLATGQVGLIDAVQTNWNSDELAIKFKELLAYIVDEIHQPYFLNSNEILVSIMKIRRGQITDKKESEWVKSNIRNKTVAIINDLNSRLKNLEKKSDDFLLDLSRNR